MGPHLGAFLAERCRFDKKLKAAWHHANHFSTNCPVGHHFAPHLRSGVLNLGYLPQTAYPPKNTYMHRSLRGILAQAAMQLLHTPAAPSKARNRRSELKQHDSPRTRFGFVLLLFHAFLFAATASGQLTANPSSIGFGSVAIGTSATQSVVLNNTGNWDVTIFKATAPENGFSISGLNLPLTLAPGQSANFTTAFAPLFKGVARGNVFLEYSRTQMGRMPVGGTTTVSLSGTGTTPSQLTASPSSLNFGNVQVGSSETLSEILTNSGSSSITISQATLTSASFALSGLALPLTLGAGQTTTFSVTFAPQSAGSSSGSINITSTASDSNLSIPLSGMGVAQGTLTANPSSLAFGSVQVGNTASLSETLTNTGGSTVSISQVSLSSASFSVSGLNEFPITLTPNQSVTFTATFAPTSSGAVSGNLSVASNASDSTLNIALSGTGTAAGTLAVSPASLNFGNVNVGSSSSLNGILTASGAAVTVQPASDSNGEFVLSGISLPATIPAGQSATFTVTFTPQSSGATSGTLSFPSNASNSPAVEALTGTGVAQTQHTVDLSWNASADAVGYNIYRGNVSGGPYSMINSSPDSATTYIDSTVVSGNTYYYVSTAVNSESQESGYSNQATAVIPNP
ncbi:MAG: choice-of-anchor D domain-containing protein [Terriglobales bacterium]